MKDSRPRNYQRLPAGLALTKDGKTLYVAAAFGHSLGRFDAETGGLPGRDLRSEPAATLRPDA